MGEKKSYASSKASLKWNKLNWFRSWEWFQHGKRRRKMQLSRCVCSFICCQTFRISGPLLWKLSLSVRVETENLSMKVMMMIIVIWCAKSFSAHHERPYRILEIQFIDIESVWICRKYNFRTEFDFWRRRRHRRRRCYRCHHNTVVENFLIIWLLVIVN